MKQAERIGRSAKPIVPALIANEASGRSVAKVQAAISTREQFKTFKSSFARLRSKERIELLRKGIEADVIIYASDYLDVSRDYLGRIIGMSPATMHRKIKKNDLLSPAESERLTRIAEIETEAEDVFGSYEKAKTWLLREHKVLGGTPLSMLDTDIGTGEVKRILGAIAYGGVV